MPNLPNGEICAKRVSNASVYTEASAIAIFAFFSRNFHSLLAEFSFS